MFSEHTFEGVAQRLKDALGLKSFNALARALGISSSSFSNRKQTNSLPYKAIVDLALSRNVSLDWLFYGQGQPFRGGDETEVSPGSEVRPRLLMEIYAQLVPPLRAPGKWQSEIGLDKADAELLEDLQFEALRRDLFQVARAGDIYNKVATISSEKKRNEIIRREVKATWDAWDLYLLAAELQGAGRVPPAQPNADKDNHVREDRPAKAADEPE